MRKITIATSKGTHVPKGEKHQCRIYKLTPGTAWRYDTYGMHEVVKVDEAISKKAEFIYSYQHFDGREMTIFKAGEETYLQPTEESDRATDDRLGKKRKIHKLRKPRREASGVAPQAINWENAGAEPTETPERQPRKRKAELQPGEIRSYRRAGPRKGLTLA